MENSNTTYAKIMHNNDDATSDPTISITYLSASIKDDSKENKNSWLMSWSYKVNVTVEVVMNRAIEVLRRNMCLDVQGEDDASDCMNKNKSKDKNDNSFELLLLDSKGNIIKKIFNV
jgi:hypothetical protein